MSSGITSKDSLFVARKPAWHGLGNVIPNSVSKEEAKVFSGIGWNVIQTPIYYGDPFSNNKMKSLIAEGLVANVREDTKGILGIVSSKYKVIQNDALFNFIDGLLNQGAKFESAGSLWEGKKVWVLAKLEDYNILGDRFEDYIFATNSFDGTSNMTAGNTSVRICCQNTLNLALNEAKRTWKLRHMGADIGSKMTEASQALNLNNKYIQALQEEADRMANIKISDDEFLKFCENLFPLNNDATDRVKNNVETLRSELQTRYMEAPDLANYKNTTWGVIQSISDMAYHTVPLRDSSSFNETRLNMVFDGSKLLDKAYNLINDFNTKKRAKVVIR